MQSKAAKTVGLNFTGEGLETSITNLGKIMNVAKKRWVLKDGWGIQKKLVKSIHGEHVQGTCPVWRKHNVYDGEQLEIQLKRQNG